MGEDAEGPPVDGEAVPLASEDLRRDVLLGAHERVRPLEARRRAARGGGDSGGLGSLGEWDPAEVAAGLARSGVRNVGVGGRSIGFGGTESSGEVEVGEGDVAGLLDEDVFGFEVAVHDVHGVKVVESAEDLGEVEADDGGGEYVICLAVTEEVEVAAGAVGDGPAH